MQVDWEIVLKSLAKGKEIFRLKGGSEDGRKKNGGQRLRRDRKDQMIASVKAKERSPLHKKKKKKNQKTQKKTPSESPHTY